MTTPSEEYCRFRHEMRDTNDPPLFCDKFIRFAYDEAERQAAKIGKLLFDRTSYVCNIPLLAGVNSYRLDESVFEVARVTVFDGVTRWTAKARDLYEYDMLQPDWRSMNFSATKSVFVYDSTIEIAGNCDFNGTLNIECYRLPLQKASDADQFEISAQHHSHLIDWAKYLAYQTRDADVEQAEYARIHEERFRAYFGGVAAQAEAARAKQRRHEVGTVLGQSRTPDQLVSIFLAESADKNYQNKDGRMLDAGWEKNLLLMYADEAEREAAARADLIFDSTTEAICKIPVTTGTKIYRIDSRINRIDNARFVGSGDSFEIKIVYRSNEYDRSESWDSDDFSSTRRLFVDDVNIELSGIVSVDGDIILSVYRSPLVNASSSGLFEISERHQSKLLHWVAYRAYMSVDNDIYHDLGLYHLKEFERYFGYSKNQDAWRYSQRNEPLVTAYQGI